MSTDHVQPCKPHDDVIGVLRTVTSFVDTIPFPGQTVQLADGTFRPVRDGHTIFLYEAGDTPDPSGLIFVEDVTPEFFDENFDIMTD